MMLNTVKRIFKLSGKRVAKIRIAFVFSFIESIFSNFPLIATLYILIKIIDPSQYGMIDRTDILISSLIIVIGLIGQYIFKLLIYHFQSASGYEIFSEERIKLGNRLKHLPMGFFNEGNIGDISAIITSDMTFVEMYSMANLDKVSSAFIGTLLSVLFLAILDWRVAIIAVSVTIPVIIILKRLQLTAKIYSSKRQYTQSRLVSSVLEYVQGMSVIKAFNMIGEKSRTTKETFRETRDQYITFEKKFIYPNTVCDLFLSFGIGLVIFITSYFYLEGDISLSITLVIFIYIFRAYLPIQAFGVLTGFIRIMDASLDRYEKIQDIETIDDDSKNIQLSNYDIQFKDVSFAYEAENVLHDINFYIPQKSMTALVGPSGCGKTTIANLIARFWDVQNGEVLVGGINVKKMTCDSLLKNISIVFQKVYLFNDTILNNIKFGKPDATYNEVVKASKKARCHDFIIELDEGYNTIVGEGGSTLSGGEKQRISIARAILKDAPIILLDEATASVDPDNEKHIQFAINELVKDKTLIVIAHRLSTIKSANQIIVLNDGKLVEKGTHEELLNLKGQYNDFWNRRVSAKSWKINNNLE